MGGGGLELGYSLFTVSVLFSAVFFVYVELFLRVFALSCLVLCCFVCCLCGKPPFEGRFDKETRGHREFSQRGFGLGFP